MYYPIYYNTTVSYDLDLLGGGYLFHFYQWKEKEIFCSNAAGFDSGIDKNRSSKNVPLNGGTSSAFHGHISIGEVCSADRWEAELQVDIVLSGQGQKLSWNTSNLDKPYLWYLKTWEYAC